MLKFKPKFYNKKLKFHFQVAIFFQHNFKVFSKNCLQKMPKQNIFLKLKSPPKTFVPNIVIKINESLNWRFENLYFLHLPLHNY